MVDGATTNYGFVKPDKTSPMSDFTTYLNNNWDAIEGVVAPNVITGALPQTGTYNVGDRVFRTDDNSIYILVCKDTTWGWFWRPVHAAIAPWITVPSTAVTNSLWNGAINPSNPFAISLDNRGNCHWRGALGLNTSTLSGNFSYTPLANLPAGLLPRESGIFTLGYEAFGAATGEVEQVRISMTTTGALSIRIQGVFTTTCQVSKVYLADVNYAIGTMLYFGA